jgi:hypothetical protein
MTRSPASDDARLLAMVDAWLAARERGTAADLATLCGDRADLLPQLRAMVGLAAGLPGHEDRDAHADHDPLLGRRLADRYLLTARLGAGGMGLVYAGRDEQLDREVAVKVLDDLFASDPARIARFAREARSLAAQVDPHIVAVHDFDLTARPPFLVMDRIVGFDLAALVRALRETAADRLPSPEEAKAAARRLLRAPAPGLDEQMDKPWPQVVALLGVQMGSALAVAHGVGVVHRDLKPSNFMLDGHGRVRLLDFGLARREADVSLTRSDTRLGTPLYMAPEQVRGEVGTPASDVYSLGATLFELLCLQPPFQGRGSELESQILYDDPPPAQRLRPRLGRDLGAVCSKALHKLPSRRYPSARDLVADLERFLRFEPVAARVVFLPSPLRGAVGLYRRYRLALAVAVGLAVLAGALALATGHFLGGQRERDAAASAQAQREAAQRLRATLSPYLGFAGGRDDRLRDPNRGKQLALLDRLLAVAPDDVTARFLRLCVRSEEQPAPPIVATDREWLADRISAERLERLFARVAVAVQQRSRTDHAAARAAMQAAEREFDPEPPPLDALARHLRIVVALQTIEVDPEHRRAIAAEMSAWVADDETDHGRTAFNCLARAAIAQIEADLRTARDLYLECHRLCPGESSTLLNLARVLRLLGQPGAARPFSAAAVAGVAVPHPNLLETHALVLIALHDFAAAEAVLPRFADDPKSRVQHAFTRVRLRLMQWAFTGDGRFLTDAANDLQVLDDLQQQGHLRPLEVRDAQSQAEVVRKLRQETPGSRGDVYLDLLLGGVGTGVADPLDVQLLDRLAHAWKEDGDPRAARLMAEIASKLRRLELDGVSIR